MAMVAFIPTAFEQPLQARTFADLKATLLDLEHTWSETGVVLSDADWLGGPGTVSPFLVIVTPGFRILLQVDPANESASEQLQLTIDTQVIEAFLKKLRSRTTKKPELKVRLTQALAIQPQATTDTALYEALILKLLRMKGQSHVQTSPESSSPTALSCQPLVDAALYQQIKQEQLVNQVTTQIRQSLELPIILQTAVDKVRECLAVDQLLIYQFDRTVSPKLKGRVAYESSMPSAIPSLRAEQWATQATAYRRYRQGQKYITAQAQQASDLLDGPTTLLYQHQVQAQIIVPLLVQERLWGLLIVHRCGATPWEQRETEFLDHITAHLVIAIHQAELYQQLQAQKQTLEEQVNQRTQELQAALIETQTAHRAKGEFLSTISHELRTPLTCVIGLSATLIRWSLGPLNDKQRDYLQTIHDSGEHLLDLINDILDLSQAESGKAILDLSQFSLSGLVKTIVHSLREQVQAEDIHLTVALQIPAQQDQFVADARRLKQILFSLLSNAIKFTPAGGAVALRAWTETNAVIFQVEDNGIGIPAHQQPLLFQKFQQLDPSRRRVYEGAGLGLALAKQLVDMHRGWIEVTSTEGQGSVFTIEIPRQSLDGELDGEDKPLKRSPASDQKVRIVLIEDQEESATLICEMLTAAGYHVVWIVEDATALQQVQFMQPTAALVSTDRLHGNGVHLIHQLRQIPERSQLKIIALAPQSEEHEPQDYLAAGADTVLTKPLSPEYLVHKVNRLVAQS
jgi:two-component system, sensor histidine kinase and response regulator